MCIRPAQRGVTLLELILAMVIVGISIAGVMTVFVITTQHSADPMARQQAQLIAEAYLDEILLKRFYDPDDPLNRVCPANEGSRSLYDNVCDYNGLNQAPTDQFGSAIAALAAYNVQVTVNIAAPPTVGAPDLNGINNTGVIRVMQVTVTVTGPNNTAVTLDAYRTNYECNTVGDPECKPAT